MTLNLCPRLDFSSGCHTSSLCTYPGSPSPSMAGSPCPNPIHHTQATHSHTRHPKCLSLLGPLLSALCLPAPYSRPPSSFPSPIFYPVTRQGFLNVNLFCLVKQAWNHIGGLQVQGQPGQFRKTMSPIVLKNEKGARDTVWW